MTATTSTRPAMGATPFVGGTTFCVWAPNADAVFVSGTFNDWNAAATPLSATGDGFWSAAVPAAHAGHEYRFVIHGGDQTLSRLDPYARQATNSVGNAVIVDPAFDWGDTPYTMPPWNELVIYELHVGTFNRQANGKPGSLATVAERLPYLAALGINAIELMPATEFAGDISWGYNPALIFAVESDYGGPAALKELIKAAHAQGIAVILDVVYNHFGPSDLDLWRFDGWSVDDGGGIYFYSDWRAATPWGATRPDYGRPEVRQYLLDNARMWLEEYRFDGLRWDATAYIRNGHGEDGPYGDIPEGWTLMQAINAAKQQQPWKIMIAEDLRNNRTLTAPLETGGAGFDTQWCGEFVHPVRQLLITPNDADRDMGAVQAAIEQRYNSLPLQRVIYTESHDEVANGKARLPEEIWPGQADNLIARKRSTLGAALVFTAPGIPMIFQGQEFLTPRWFSDQEGLDWSRAERWSGIVRLYGDLIRLRRNWHNTTAGLRGSHVQVFHVNNTAKVVAFQRWEAGGPGDTTVVVLSFANTTQSDYILGLPGPGSWRLRLNSDSRAYGDDYADTPSGDLVARTEPRDGLPCSGTLAIGPYAALIYSQDRSETVQRDAALRSLGERIGSWLRGLAQRLRGQ